MIGYEASEGLLIDTAILSRLGWKSYGVFQMPHTPLARVASGKISQLSWQFTKARPLLFGPNRNSESISSSVKLTVRLDNKNGYARKENDFLCICTTLVILRSIFKCSNTLDYIATLFRHQFMHCTVLLCIQYNIKLCCLFSGWFAK